jgi:hypothetical protein
VKEKELVQQRAISSLLDVVQEIAAEVGDDEWYLEVQRAFDQHRRELLTGEVEEDIRFH